MGTLLTVVGIIAAAVILVGVGYKMWKSFRKGKDDDSSGKPPMTGGGSVGGSGHGQISQK